MSYSVFLVVWFLEFYLEVESDIFIYVIENKSLKLILTNLINRDLIAGWSYLSNLNHAF